VFPWGEKRLHGLGTSVRAWGRASNLGSSRSMETQRLGWFFLSPPAQPALQHPTSGMNPSGILWCLTPDFLIIVSYSSPLLFGRMPECFEIPRGRCRGSYVESRAGLSRLSWCSRSYCKADLRPFSRVEPLHACAACCMKIFPKNALIGYVLLSHEISFATWKERFEKPSSWHAIRGKLFVNLVR
jgi:hypothetical protein